MRRWVWGTVVVMVAVGGVVGALGMTFGWQWGDVPTWVGAVATVVALAAAGVGARFAYGQLAALRSQVQLQADALRLQQEQAEVDRAEAAVRAEERMKLLRIEARRQAELIDVAPGIQTATLAVGAVLPGMLSVRIENRSSRPIRNVASRLVMLPHTRSAYGVCDGDYQGQRGPVILDRKPLAPLAVVRRAESVKMLFPVQEQSGTGTPATTHILWDLNSDDSIADPPLPGQSMISPGITYLIRFTDDAKQHWELDGDMHLEPITDRIDW